MIAMREDTSPPEPVAPGDLLTAGNAMPQACCAERSGLDARQQALAELGRWLLDEGYSFTTVTPATHARVNARPADVNGDSLRDIFGWSRGFQPGTVPSRVLQLLRGADELVPRYGQWFSAVRFSTLDGRLYVHSAYPTCGSDAVFFGPDSYRFAAFVAATVPPARLMVDIGCGSGVGGLQLAGRMDRVILGDINPKALRYAQVNAAMGGWPHVECVASDILDGVVEAPEVIIANPPYLVDALARTYRNGCGPLGLELGVRIVRDAMSRLAPGGMLAMYSGAPIIAGRDPLLAEIEPLLAAHHASYSYQEIDPDVFGEELESSAYAKVDRIAAVTLVAVKPGNLETWS